MVGILISLSLLVEGQASYLYMANRLDNPSYRARLFAEVYLKAHLPYSAPAVALYKPRSSLEGHMRTLRVLSKFDADSVYKLVGLRGEHMIDALITRNLKRNKLKDWLYVKRYEWINIYVRSSKEAQSALNRRIHRLLPYYGRNYYDDHLKNRDNTQRPFGYNPVATINVLRAHHAGLRLKYSDEEWQHFKYEPYMDSIFDAMNACCWDSELCGSIAVSQDGQRIPSDGGQTP